MAKAIEGNRRQADLQQQAAIDAAPEQRKLAQVAGEMEQRGDAQHRFEVEEHVRDRHEEHRGAKAANGACDLGEQRQRKKNEAALEPGHAVSDG